MARYQVHDTCRARKGAFGVRFCVEVRRGEVLGAVESQFKVASQLARDLGQLIYMRRECLGQA